MRNIPPLKMPRKRKEWDNIETRESNKALSQAIGWNLGRRQCKMTVDSSRTQISEPSPSNVEKRNSSKHWTVLEKSIDKLESIQMKSRTYW
jgi:hypothetical protein